MLSLEISSLYTYPTLADVSSEKSGADELSPELAPSPEQAQSVSTADMASASNFIYLDSFFNLNLPPEKSERTAIKSDFTAISLYRI